MYSHNRSLAMKMASPVHAARHAPAYMCSTGKSMQRAKPRSLQGRNAATALPSRFGRLERRVQRIRRAGVEVVHRQHDELAGEVLVRQPLDLTRPVRLARRSVTSTRRQPSSGANRMNRLLAPLRSYSQSCFSASPGRAGSGLRGLPARRKRSPPAAPPPHRPEPCCVAATACAGSAPTPNPHPRNAGGIGAGSVANGFAPRIYATI